MNDGIAAEMGLGQFDDETVRLALWLQGHIYQNGLEGVRYMEHARLWAEREADDVLARRISKELRKL